MGYTEQTMQQLKVATVVAFYMFAALVMVLVNKAVLNVAPDLPLLFLSIQALIAVILLHVSSWITPMVVIPKLTMETAGKMIPIITVGGVALTFNTLCLRGVDVTFFQIARGLVLPFTITVSSFHTRSKPEFSTIIAAAIVTVGFFIGVTPNKLIFALVSPAYIGLVYGVLSSLAIAFHSVLIKTSLRHCDNSPIQLAYWMNLGGLVATVPFILFTGELSTFSVLWADETWNRDMFIWGSLITGVFGFLLCISNILSIKITSPTTHMFSGAVRSVLQTVFGVMMFGDIINSTRVTSICVILGGTMYYTWLKSQPRKPAGAAVASAPDLERGPSTTTPSNPPPTSTWPASSWPMKNGAVKEKSDA